MEKLKNVVIIVIDALSKWYIDQCKNETSVFSFLEKSGYCASNMYSTGPFTEAAVRGFWAADDALRGKSYLLENGFRKETLYQLLKKMNYYIYLGKLIPFLNDNIVSDNKMSRETLGARGFEHIWRGRLEFYIDLYKNNKIKNTDFWKIDYLISGYFNEFSKTSYVKDEYKKYTEDNSRYILDILINEKKSSFFMNQDHSMYDTCKYRNIHNYMNQCTHETSKEEMEFIYNVRDKNTKFLMEMNKMFICNDTIEYELNGSRSRCIHSNENILSHMRDECEKLPKLKEELDEFIEWFDEVGRKIDSPYFAYIHNYDFHYPENFMNNRFEKQKSLYYKEIVDKIEIVKQLKNKNMSVSKQLSILNIDKCLSDFLEKIKERKMAKNTVFVITADHGISNFMYPINKKNERWNFTKINFQVPFYMFGCNIRKFEDDRIYSSKVILPTILKVCQEEKFYQSYLDDEREFITTSWINGVPDYDHQKIKLGIRTKEYSITYESFLSQFFSYDNIIGLYDLLEDPDECNNLSYKEVKNEAFFKLIQKLPDLWFEEIIEIILSDEGEYGLKEKYKFLTDKIDYFKMLNKKAKYLSEIQFQSYIKEKSIVLLGDKESVTAFLTSNNFPYKIEALWITDSEDAFLMGHSIENQWNKKKYARIVIVGNDEMKLLNDLIEKKFATDYLIQKRKYYIS